MRHTGDRDLRLLPKAELHIHLLGAMRQTTMAELAVAEGIETPDPRVFGSFTEFQRLFQAAFDLCTARPENMRRMVREIVADVAADGGVWVQGHFNPHVFSPLGEPDEVMELVLSEGFAAGSEYGVGFGLTMAASRHGTPEAAEDLARYAARYAGRGVHALGMTGNDTVAPAAAYAKAFAIAREAGLTAAPHAGELSGPDDVRSAAEDLGATRIAHGVRAAEDPAVLEFLAARGVSLDVCPTSNLLLGIVPSLAEHPLPALLAAGVRCSLGSDDPLMFGVGLYDEYSRARTEMGLSDEQLADIARTSLETSDAPAELIATGLAGVESWLQPRG
ncbi:adenosine deaminase [Kribbella qitaiheensis]|uniref:Adenosine deaminase n=1 Tax=Kribbella qitaiheensis TaxID=1544730 RepID=A0A7G6X1V0_9ACTN|nr:adenosine deaminase [Kribbella qitaiheensis]QNE20215.1 adenosine deaminase [Kribbella qitaiheensis]